jgi:aryl-alcohol dehydrogenase-like predicted oxidoreductase
VDAATAIAAHRNRPIPQVALAWLLGVPGVTAPIIGPRTLEQLDGLLDATEIHLDPHERRALEEPAPPPEIAPHRMLHGQIGLPDIPSLRRPQRR